MARFGGSPRRQALLDGLRRVLLHLTANGCQRVYLGGGFVTTKRAPKDVDLVWDITGVDIETLPDVFCGPEGVPALLAACNCHVFPSHLREADTNATFVEFFQQRKDGDPRPVGIVQLEFTNKEFS